MKATPVGSQIAVPATVARSQLSPHQQQRFIHGRKKRNWSASESEVFGGATSVPLCLRVPLHRVLQPQAEEREKNIPNFPLT